MFLEMGEVKEACHTCIRKHDAPYPQALNGDTHIHRSQTSIEDGKGMRDEWGVGKLCEEEVVSITVGTDYDGTCPIEGNGTAKYLSPFVAVERDKTPGLEVGCAWCKAAGLQDQVEVILIDIRIAEFTAAPPVQDGCNHLI